MITLTKNETIFVCNFFNELVATKNVTINPFFNDGKMTFGVYVDFVTNKNTKYVIGIENVNKFTITNVNGNDVNIDDIFDELVHYIDFSYDVFGNDCNYNVFEYHYTDNNQTQMIVIFK